MCVPPAFATERFTDSELSQVTAYSPLGQNITGFPPVIGHETVKSVASKLGVSPAAVLIAWGVQRGTSVIPKSVTPSRLQVS